MDPDPEAQKAPKKRKGEKTKKPENCNFIIKLA
jgi:hypothetical protein